MRAMESQWVDLVSEERRFLVGGPCTMVRVAVVER